MPDCTAPNTTNTLPAEPILEPVDPEVEDLQLLTEEDILEVKIVEVEGEDLEAVSESLEAYSALLKEAGAKGITHQSAAFMRVGMNHVDHILGYSKSSTGLESYKTSTLRDGLRHVVISQEDIKERAKETVTKFIEFIKKLFAKAMELWDQVAGPKTKVAAKAETLKETVKVYPAYPGGRMRGEVPSDAPEDLKKHAEEIKSRGESDKETGKIKIDNAGAVFAGSTNTYNTIDRELAYITFIHETWPKAQLRILAKLLQQAKTANSADDFMYEAIVEVHEEILSLTNSSIGDKTLPGGKALIWKEDITEFVVNTIEYTGSDSIEVDLRSSSELAKFTDSISKLITSGPFSKTPKAKEIEDAAARVTGALIDNRNMAEKILPVMNAFVMLVRKFQSVTTFAALDQATLRSLNLKLEIAKRELLSY